MVEAKKEQPAIAEASTEPKRVMVYTEYGYAYVDLEQFKVQM